MPLLRLAAVSAIVQQLFGRYLGEVHQGVVWPGFEPMQQAFDHKAVAVTGEVQKFVLLNPAATVLAGQTRVFEFEPFWPGQIAVFCQPPGTARQ